ncbi:MliC family protein [Turneriella parva]|uniref:C-type lysozyme inhibitor domain-containing protein n=1 Tax=Turneriella parva (strain ATCC BAA-1111 / DSM 21527 / NCTC 11395 / H) TaxID=869212 RepID=I4B1V0_TURPD|nr:MliC family protein [Turneriella parva]AFM11257.1 Protein of unknown function DUF2091, periplasmic [Turneriella parva DSM 21527]
MKSRIFTLLSLLFFQHSHNHLQAESQPRENKVHYRCAAGKTVYAAFWLGEPGKVRLKLSDGRSYRLPQVMSASGVKYAKNEDQFIFWSKGDSAFILENDVMTYRDCKSRK